MWHERRLEGTRGGPVRNEMEMCSERRSGLRFQAGYGTHAGHFSQVHKAKIRDKRCSQSIQKWKWAKDNFYCLYILLFIYLIESHVVQATLKYSSEEFGILPAKCRHYRCTEYRNYRCAECRDYRCTECRDYRCAHHTQSVIFWDWIQSIMVVARQSTLTSQLHPQPVLFYPKGNDWQSNYYSLSHWRIFIRGYFVFKMMSG